MSIRVVTASEAAGLDANAVARGVPSRDLMRAAGEGAAQLLMERFPLETGRGVAVFTGAGNNGGDGWVLAGALARRGVRVRVHDAVAAATPDAMAARDAASAHLAHAPPDGSEGVLVDALLGTGARGVPRGPIAAAIERIESRRSQHDVTARRPRVLSLDIPSGVDATTGDAPGVAVRADVTATFGSVKRGLLLNRALAGGIAVIDIGLAAESASSSAPLLVDAAFVRSVVPPIPADAHKGTRKRLVIVGGSLGMAGAVILASRAARRSGIGMVRLCVARDSIAAVQAAEPAATAVPWPETTAEIDALAAWAHVMLVGPGLGLESHAHQVAERLLAATTCPVVLDADALRFGGGTPDGIRQLLGGRVAVLTPHAAECARLTGQPVEEVQRGCFSIAREVATAAGAVVLLKGTPTVVSDGLRIVVSAAGSPVLATAGSGDILSGIVATLLGQGPHSAADALAAAAAAAWTHGHAAEIAGAGSVRGVALEDVIDALRLAWRFEPRATAAPVLAELASVGSDRDLFGGEGS